LGLDKSGDEIQVAAKFINLKKLSQFSLKKKIGIAAIVVVVGVLPTLAVANPQIVQSAIVQVQNFLTNNQAQATASTEVDVIPYNGSDSRIVQVAHGYSVSFALRDDGTLWAWGDNAGANLNTLGIGATWSQYATPQQVHVPAGHGDSWKYLAAGTTSAAAIAEDGSMWEWGLAGMFIFNFQFDPVRVGTASHWESVSIGNSTGIALDDQGRMWTWIHGPIGEFESSPILVANPAGVNEWQSISAGVSSWLALDDSGRLFSWGGNASGELGRPGATATPMQVVAPGGPTTWRTASAGQGHAVAVGADGSLWTWGSNEFGALATAPLGGPTTWGQRNYPARVGTANHWDKAFATWVGATAITTDGELWSWGANAEGQLGRGTRGGAGTYNPQPVNAPAGIVWDTVAEGLSNGHTLAIDSEGNMWAWGHNNTGQLGKGIFHVWEPLNNHPTTTNTNNWIPWRVAASLIPTTSGAGQPWPGVNGNWAVPNNATLPVHNEPVPRTPTNQPTITVFFDRPMNPDAVLQNDIGATLNIYVVEGGVATNTVGAIVNIAEGSFRASTASDPGGDRGANTVFEAPLTLLVPNATLEATVVDFLDASVGVGGSYPHTWRFITGPFETGTDFNFTKTQEDAVTPLAGAVFHLFERNAANTGWESTSAQTATSISPLGATTFTGLTSGSQYQLREVSAPAPFIVPTGYWIITTGESGDIVSVASHGTSQPVFSGGPSSWTVYNLREETEPAEGQITKHLVFPIGTPRPDLSFDFVFTPVVENLSDSPTSPVLSRDDHPSLPASANPLTIEPNVVDEGSTTTTLTASSDLGALINSLAFPGAGVFIWNLHEETGSSNTTLPSSVVYDQNRFQIRVHVDLSGRPINIEVVTLELVSGSWVPNLDNKPNYIEFINVYQRRGDLDITKTIPEDNPVNEGADPNTLFDFSITLVGHDTLSAGDGTQAPPLPATVNATIIGRDGNPVAAPRNPVTIPIISNTGTQTFQLMHGERLILNGTHGSTSLPYGTTWEVTEYAHHRFAPSATITTGGTTLTPSLVGGPNSDLSTDDRVLTGGGTNRAAFENTFLFAPPAGLILQNLPLAVPILALVGLVVLLTLRKRKSIEDMPIRL